MCSETFHSPQVIQRYISTFKQILLCKKKGMATDEISCAIGITKRLVKEYTEILNGFRRRNGKIVDIINYGIEVVDIKC